MKKRFNIKWSYINSFGQMRYSRTSYYVLIFVPILVKLTEKINYPTQFLGLGIESEIQLPFSWYIFYLGAVLIALGSIIFQLLCPSLIKKYKNYGAFVEAGESAKYLSDTKYKYKLDLDLNVDEVFGERPWIEEKTFKPEKKESNFVMKRLLPNEPEMITVGFKQNPKYYALEKDAFNKLYNAINLLRPKWALFAYCCYILGFIAIAWITLENIYYVLNTFVNTLIN